MPDKRHIDEKMLEEVIARATEIETARSRRLSHRDVVAIAADLGIEASVVKQALRDVRADGEARKSRRSQMMTALMVALAIAGLAGLFHAVGDGDAETAPAATSAPAPPRTKPLAPPRSVEPPVAAPTPRPKPAPVAPPAQPLPPVRPAPPKSPRNTPSPLPFAGKSALKAKAIVGVWRLTGYQMAMDGRSVEMPLRRGVSALDKNRETWTFRKDGTFTHRFSSNLWFSGKWRLGDKVKVPDPLRPTQKLEVVHLITSEVSTSMMTQRPVDHYLVGLTSGKALLTWYVGVKGPPTMRALKQGHRFKRIAIR